MVTEIQNRESEQRSPAAGGLTAGLLMGGILAGPIYLLAGLSQAILREGFDPRLHALSHLANGPWGWVQTTNFLVAGSLVLAGAMGTRRALAGTRGGTWGPILLAIFGLGLIGSGLFPADPAPGFPPGAPAPESMSQQGLLHFVFGGIAFYALIAACFVFARRMAKHGQKWWALYSTVTGVGFFLSFAAIASGTGGSTALLLFYGAVAWIWLWHTLLIAHIQTPGRL
jgi:hypothetical protein